MFVHTPLLRPSEQKKVPRHGVFTIAAGKILADGFLRRGRSAAGQPATRNQEGCQ